MTWGPREPPGLRATTSTYTAVGSNSVDLVYLDPPFNSNKAYNVFFDTDAGEKSQAQIEAFDDVALVAAGRGAVPGAARR